MENLTAKTSKFGRYYIIVKVLLLELTKNFLLVYNEVTI